MEAALQGYRSSSRIVGFVPTMGALHRGHTELMVRGTNECDVLVACIFVNPTQFNDPTDLKNYPRTLDEDTDKCSHAGVHILFTPSVQEIYPQPDTRVFSFGLLGEVMEGKHRPGHFNGVAQVVSRLFSIVKPTRAYFGQKDYQQLAIIRRLVEMLRIPTEIVACPTVREPDGLAMSSRNMLLTKEQRAAAPLIAKTLAQANGKRKTLSVAQVSEWVVRRINTSPQLNVEYFQVAHAQTLEPIERWDDAPQAVGCIAVRAGKVRLIDNIIFD